MSRSEIKKSIQKQLDGKRIDYIRQHELGKTSNRYTICCLHFSSKHCSLKERICASCKKSAEQGRLVTKINLSRRNTPVSYFHPNLLTQVILENDDFKDMTITFDYESWNIDVLDDPASITICW